MNILFYVVFLLVSMIPIYLLLDAIYNQDEIEKEPKKLLLLAFLGGCISLFVTKILAGIYQHYIPFLIESNPDLEPYKIFLISFGEIGLIEELCKWLILYIVIWKKKDFNYVFDAVVYATFVSLGFATIENFFYLWNANLFTVIARSLFTIPGHAAFGIIMGYYFGFAKYYKTMEYKNKYTQNIYCSLFFAIVYHGLFDFILAFDNTYSSIIYIVFYIYLGINAIYKVHKIKKLELTWEE